MYESDVTADVAGENSCGKLSPTSVYIMVDVEEFLRSRAIPYVLHEHPPVFTCEELEKYSVPGLACKNLFLRDQKKKRYFLFVLPADQRTDLAWLGEQVGEKKLSFANKDTLQQMLGVESGAVSPFALLNDHSAAVELILSQRVTEAPLLHFHPNRNTASLEITGDAFRAFLQTLRNSKVVLSL